MSGGVGLSVPMAVLLLAGEMAGLGVLALPHSMLGTGPAGFFLVVYFTVIGVFNFIIFFVIFFFIIFFFQ